MPLQLSRVVLLITENMETNDPIEIRILVEQFVKYDDWKRLTARGRLKSLFIQKMEEIENDKFMEWDSLMNSLTFLSIDDVVSYLKSVKNEMKSSKSDNFDFNPTWIDFKGLNEYYEEFEAKSLDKHILEYSQIKKEYENAKVWFFMDEDLLPLKRAEINKYNKPLTTHELAVLMTETYPIIDKKGVYNKEEVLKRKNFFQPKISSQETLENTFEKVITFLDYPHKKKFKEELMYKLSIGLSNHVIASNELLNLNNIVDSNIMNKDFENIRKQLNLH